jgi:hypothetical protein
VIQIKTLLAEMAEDPTYLYYAVSNLLEFGEGPQPGGVLIGCGRFDNYLEKKGLFDWERAEQKFNSGEDTSAWRQAHFSSKGVHLTLPKAQKFIEAAFKAGYITEALNAQEALRVTQRADYDHQP